MGTSVQEIASAGVRITAEGAAQAKTDLSAVKGAILGIGTAATDATATTKIFQAQLADTRAVTALQAQSNSVAHLQEQLSALGKEHPSIAAADNFKDVGSRLTALQAQLKDLAAKPQTLEVRLEAAQVQQQLAGIRGEMIGLESQATATKGTLTGLSDTLVSGLGTAVAIGGVLALADGIKEAVSASIEWKTTLNELQGNTTLTDAAIRGLDSAVKDMVGSSAADMNQLASGYEHATNLGFSLADSTKIADASMKSALSTGANLGQVMNADASVMKEFGDSGAKAALDLNLMHNAAAQGNMELQAFVESGGKTIATAANLGDSLQDISAAYAALTRHGMDAAMAGTQLTGILTHIVAPSSAAKSEIEHLSQVTGIDLVKDFSQAGLQAKGLYGIFQDVQKATAGDSAEILRLIPALRGGQGALVLAGSGAQDFTDILSSQADIISGKTDPTEAAFARTTETTGYKLGEAANQAKLFALTLGDTLVTAIEDAIQGINHFQDVLIAAGGGESVNGVNASNWADKLHQAYTQIQKDSADTSLSLRQVGKDADELRKTSQANAAAMASSYQTTGRALMALDDESSTSLHKMGQALGQMAADTVKGSKDASAGINDLYLLLHSLPDTLSPDMDKLRQDLTGEMAQITKDGGASAADLHAFYVGEIHKMVESTDLETHNLGLVLQNNLNDAEAKAGKIGQETGDAYVASLASGASGGMPAVKTWLNNLLSTMNVSQITALLGAQAGREFAVNLAAQEANALRQAVADAQAVVGSMMDSAMNATDSATQKHMLQMANAQQAGIQAMNRAIAADDATVKAGLSDLGLILNDAGKKVNIYADDTAKGHKKASDAAAAAARAQAISAEQMIKDLGKLGLETVDGTKTVAQAYDDLLPILTAKLPAGMDWLQKDYRDLLAQLTSATPPSLDQIQQDFQAWNARLLSDQDASHRLLAQSNLDAFNQAELAWQKHLKDQADAQAKAAQDQRDKETAAAAKLLSDQQGVLSGLAGIVQIAADPKHSLGALMSATLDLASKATDAKMGPLADKLLGYEHQMASGQAINLNQMEADFGAFLDAYKASGDPKEAAIAQSWRDMLAQMKHDQAVAQQQMIDDWTKADRQRAQEAQSARDAMQQANEGLATSLGALGKAIISGQDSPTQALIALAQLAKQAGDAGLNPLVAKINDMIAHGASLADILQLVNQAEAQLAANGDPLAAVLVREAQAEMAASAAEQQRAAAVQAATAVLKQYQDAQKAAQDAVNANSAALQAAQNDLQNLQGQYSAAEQAIRGFQSAQLVGEGAANKQIFASQQDVLHAKIALEQAQLGGASAASLKPLQDAYDLAQKKLQLLQDQTSATFDPQKEKLKEAADAALGLDKELSLKDALEGITKARDRMTELAPKIRHASDEVAWLTRQQGDLKAALDAATARVAAQQQAISDLQNGITTATTTALTPLPGQFAATWAGVAATLDPHLDPSNDQGILGKWGTTSTSLLASMLKRIGPPAGSGVTGGAYSFRPNATLAMSGTLTDMTDAITSGMPDLLAAWSGDSGLHGMVNATQSAVQEVKDAINSLNGLSVTLSVTTHEKQQQQQQQDNHQAGQDALVPRTSGGAQSNALFVPLGGSRGAGVATGTAAAVYNDCVFINDVEVTDPDVQKLLRRLATVTAQKNGGG